LAGNSTKFSQKFAFTQRTHVDQIIKPISIRYEIVIHYNRKSSRIRGYYI